VIVRVHEDVIGRLPTTREQELLKIVRNAPVLEVQRANYAEDNSVVMFNWIIFVASYFVLSYNYTTPLWTGKSSWSQSNSFSKIQQRSDICPYASHILRGRLCGHISMTRRVLVPSYLCARWTSRKGSVSDP
jgi:hypothetical protein